MMFFSRVENLDSYQRAINKLIRFLIALILCINLIALWVIYSGFDKKSKILNKELVINANSILQSHISERLSILVNDQDFVSYLNKGEYSRKLNSIDMIVLFKKFIDNHFILGVKVENRTENSILTLGDTNSSFHISLDLCYLNGQINNQFGNCYDKLIIYIDLRKPYPLSWDEQHKLFKELPAHLEKMALFAVNTGCRDQEICELRWDWEIKIPELPHLMVFIIPAELVKNGEERLVICNDAARSVVESERRKHDTHVFTFRGKPLARILSTGWRQARIKTKLQQVRVHDLKHTFGRRLRAAGVSFEDRQDLLGHRSGRITTHYSSAELQNLYEAANKVCEKQKNGVVLTVLRNPNYRKPVSKQASKVVTL